MQFHQEFPSSEQITESDLLPHPDLHTVADRFGMEPGQITRYLDLDEKITGFGTGGSESLVIFVDNPMYGKVVRKVCSESLSAVPWDPDGTGVMVPPSTKGGLQADYIRGLPETVKDYFPAVHNIRTEQTVLPCGTPDRKLIFDQSVIEGTEVSAFIASEQPSPEVVAHLHYEIMRLLADKIHTERLMPNHEDTIQESYLDKITARLELSRQAAPQTFSPLLDAERIVINGETYRNIPELLEFFGKPDVQAMLEPRYHSLVMGDTNTENIMITNPETLLEAMQTHGKPEFNYDDIGLKFIDPRAIGFRTVGCETVDDYMYDNKPPHNTLGNYDVIHNEHFDLSAMLTADIPVVNLSHHKDNPYQGPYKGIEQHFQYVMEGWNVSSEAFQQQDPNWLLRFTFMMGSHFAAMPPFHFKRELDGTVPEDTEMQKRAIAIYCEGVQWLNKAMDMILGDRKDLYGIPLGKIHADNRK